MAPRLSIVNTQADLAAKTFVLDNGAYTIKAGYSSPDPKPTDCSIIQNTIAHSARDRATYIGSQLENCNDFGELAYRRPVQKGFVVNWEAQKAIWEHSFFDHSAKLKVDPKDTNLILTEAPNCMEALQNNTDEMVFEYFQFATYHRCLAASLNAYNDISSIYTNQSPTPPAPPVAPIQSLLVVDTSYSHTTVIPLLSSAPLQSAIRRLSPGGKLLTNFLKEQASIRHFNVIEETHLLNDAKEASVYISHDFRKDMDLTWAGGARDDAATRRYDETTTLDFVLPDYETVKKGYVRPHAPAVARSKIALREDILPLSNERFRTPELIFNPTDTGIPEAGLPEAIVQSLSALPEGLRPAMCSNIIVVGGNTLISGLVQRLSEEVRTLLPREYPVRVSRAPDPIVSTWLGGARLGADREALRDKVVTRKEYEEMGVGYLQKRFSGRA